MQWWIPQDSWQWDQVSNWQDDVQTPVIYDLSAGAHQLFIRSREHDSRLDVIEITNDLSYVPGP